MESDCKIREQAHRNRFTTFKRLNVRLGLPSTIMATITGALVTIGVSAPASAINMSGLEIFALVASWLVAALTATISFLRPLENSNMHRQKAVEYCGLLDEIERTKAFKEGADLQSSLEKISKEIEKLKKSEPSLNDGLIIEARKALGLDLKLTERAGSERVLSDTVV